MTSRMFLGCLMLLAACSAGSHGADAGDAGDGCAWCGDGFAQLDAGELDAMTAESDASSELDAGATDAGELDAMTAESDASSELDAGNTDAAELDATAESDASDPPLGELCSPGSIHAGLCSNAGCASACSVCVPAGCGVACCDDPLYPNGTFACRCAP